MLKDKIIDKVLHDISLDFRIEDGIFDIKNNEHLGYLCEYFINKGIERTVVYEFTDMLLEKGKYPERQAYNRNGILVTFPTPQYKHDAIKAGTHFENDPTKGHSNLFQEPVAEPKPATSPEDGRDKSPSTPTKTNLPVSTSTAVPSSTEKSGEETSEPAQPMPNVFTSTAPQQSPEEEPEEEPTELPDPKPKNPEEKDAEKGVIKKIITGDDYMLEGNKTFISDGFFNDINQSIKMIFKKIEDTPNDPLKTIKNEVEFVANRLNISLYE